MDNLVYFSFQERCAHIELSGMKSVSMGKGKKYMHCLEVNNRTESLVVV